MADKPLSTKQELFIAAYLGEAKSNATEAARMAGYAHPNVQGPRLLANVGIAARIRAVVDEHGMTAKEVLQELAAVARADWKDFVRVTGRAKNGEATAVQSDISSKIKALELMGKHHGLFAEKQQIDVNIREHYRAVPQSTLDKIIRPAESRPDA